MTSQTLDMDRWWDRGGFSKSFFCFFFFKISFSILLPSSSSSSLEWMRPKGKAGSGWGGGGDRGVGGVGGISDWYMVTYTTNDEFDEFI